MSEGPAHRFDLPDHIPIYIGRQEFVVEYARGKNVLHLGCVDTGQIEQKRRKDLWLHDRIDKVAKTLWGVDIDEAGLESMRAQGYRNLYLADIENLASVPELFNQEFELILLTEVLEHLNNPGHFLGCLSPLFGYNTEMLVTVPNATSLANILENLRGRELVHPDHNYWYSLHTIQSLFDKYGYDSACVGVYSQHNYHVSISGHVWRRILHYAGIRQTTKSNGTVQSAIAERNPRPVAWLSATLTTIVYRLLLPRRKFFADGLILLVKPRLPDPVMGTKG